MFWIILAGNPFDTDDLICASLRPEADTTEKGIPFLQGKYPIKQTCVRGENIVQENYVLLPSMHTHLRAQMLKNKTLEFIQGGQQNIIGTL